MFGLPTWFPVTSVEVAVAQVWESYIVVTSVPERRIMVENMYY